MDARLQECRFGLVCLFGTRLQEIKLKRMNPEQSQHSRELSWAAMLVLLFLAIAVAASIAYWMIYPYIHQHPR